MKTAGIWFLRLLLAAVLGYAGAAKLGDPAAFATSIEHFRLVPPVGAALLAVYLPWLELVLAGGLLLERGKRPAALLSGLLFAAFTLVLASAWARGLDVECGCFGRDTTTSVYVALARNLVLIAAAAVVARRA